MLSKYIQGAIYFFSGMLSVTVLDYVVRYAQYRAGGSPREGDLLTEVLVLILLTLVYYGFLLLVIYGLSLYKKRVLERAYLLPLSLAAGVVTAFVFQSNADFLFWLVYREDMGTIFLSAFIIELVFLLMNFVGVIRLASSERNHRQNIGLHLVLFLSVVILLIFGLPLVFN